MASFWRLTVESEFCAAHALRHYEGKCENIHGHNFFVAATIEGETLTKDTELLIDFSVLKKALKEILEKIDHKDLNLTPPFEIRNPSSENISRFIFQSLIEYVVPYGARVHSVKVAEKNGQSATYYEVEK